MEAYRDPPWQQWARPMRVAWGLVILLLAQAYANEPSGRLVVGTMHAPPFASHTDDGQWSGLSVELLQQIAGTLGVEVEWREYDYDLQGLLSAVEQRHVDAAIAALPMTSTYEESVDFSYAYFRTGQGIAVLRKPPQPLLAILHGLFSWRFLLGVASLVGLLFGMGTMIWLLERRRNPHHFRPKPVQGVTDGIWWAAVTMTTVGYGDKTPMTWAGRLMSLLWMFGSIFFITFFAAALASSFTVVRLQQSVNGPEDLPWARVAVVAGTRGEELLAAHGLQPRAYPFIIQACKALLRGEIEAVVYNKAILDYMIKDYGWKELAVLPHTLLVEDYAVVLPTGSELRELMNRALLQALYSPAWKTLLQRYVNVAE
jgi:polar amino acid transport system substrate-binding protein